MATNQKVGDVVAIIITTGDRTHAKAKSILARSSGVELPDVQPCEHL